MCFIFDFNGTCFFDTLINFKAWTRSVHTWFNREFTMDEYQEYNGRTGRETIIQLFKDEDLPEDRLAKLTRFQEENYLCVCRESKNLCLAPGLAEFVKTAKEKGIKVAICTSATADLMKEFRKMLPVDSLFDEENIITTDGTFPSKPDPAIYRYAMEKLHVKPSECRVFEDTRSGIRSAYDAGVKSIVAITGDNLAQLETNVPLFMKCADYYPVLSVLKEI